MRSLGNTQQHFISTVSVLNFITEQYNNGRTVVSFTHTQTLLFKLDVTAWESLIDCINSGDCIGGRII